jgi:hypothetical protein
VRVYDGAAIDDGVFAPNPQLHQLVSFLTDGFPAGIGAYVGVGDTNGDGFADIIVGAFANTSNVRVYDGKDVADNTFSTAGSLLNQFNAYDLQFSVGVSIGAADFNGDGDAEILTGPGSGSPNFRVVQGDATGTKPSALLDGTSAAIEGGINVAV